MSGNDATTRAGPPGNDQKQTDSSRSEQSARGSGSSGRGRGGGRGGAKLRGRPNESPEVRMSKTLSYILRHGSQAEHLKMRPDGYVRVDELLQRPKLRELTFEGLQDIVKADAKQRYSLKLEANPATGEEVWWIRANQGHSMKSVVMDYDPIKSVSDIPTGIAVHGTNKRAWESIKEQGLKKMSRNHIHLAQGVPGTGVISGMRKSSEILIYVDVQKALDAGIKFYLSTNGVVLTEGDSHGVLGTQFFSKVETADGQSVPGWDGPRASGNQGTPSNTVDTAKQEQRLESIGVGPSKSEAGVQVSTVSEEELHALEKKIQSTAL
ncbi:KptA family-domain-containing protein [Trametes elegans]|nr:KptA family-domain-containing protein [Trametes elegans]